MNQLLKFKKNAYFVASQIIALWASFRDLNLIYGILRA